MRIFEVDRPGPQAWKRRRLLELGYGVPDRLTFVPVDFETDRWDAKLDEAGFDAAAPVVVVSAGVSMYLTRDATAATLRRAAAFAPGSLLAMTFLLPADLLDVADRPGLEAAARGAGAAGTPFRSFYRPGEMLALARKAGFRNAGHTSPGERYFAGRPDGLKPSTGEDLLVATT